MWRKGISSALGFGSSALYMLPGLGAYLSLTTGRFVPEEVKKLDISLPLLSVSRAIVVFPLIVGVPIIYFNNPVAGVILGLTEVLGYGAGLSTKKYREWQKIHDYK